MNCHKCETKFNLKKVDVVGKLVEKILVEEDSFCFVQVICTKCDYVSPICTRIIGTKKI